MAGSLDYFSYRADDNTFYSVLVDESNAEGTFTVGNVQLMEGLTGNFPRLPTSIKKRYILCFLSGNPLIKRKFYVGTQAKAASVFEPGQKILAAPYPDPAGNPGVPQEWTITAFRGEKSSISRGATSQDTGLIDGDN